MMKIIDVAEPELIEWYSYTGRKETMKYTTFKKNPSIVMRERGNQKMWNYRYQSTVSGNKEGLFWGRNAGLRVMGNEENIENRLRRYALEIGLYH